MIQSAALFEGILTATTPSGRGTASTERTSEGGFDEVLQGTRRSRESGAELPAATANQTKQDQNVPVFPVTAPAAANEDPAEGTATAVTEEPSPAISAAAGAEIAAGECHGDEEGQATEAPEPADRTAPEGDTIAIVTNPRSSAARTRKVEWVRLVDLAHSALPEDGGEGKVAGESALETEEGASAASSGNAGSWIEAGAVPGSDGEVQGEETLPSLDGSQVALAAAAVSAAAVEIVPAVTGTAGVEAGGKAASEGAAAVRGVAVTSEPGVEAGSTKANGTVSVQDAAGMATSLHQPSQGSSVAAETASEGGYGKLRQMVGQGESLPARITEDGGEGEGAPSTTKVQHPTQGAEEVGRGTPVTFVRSSLSASSFQATPTMPGQASAGVTAAVASTAASTTAGKIEAGPANISEPARAGSSEVKPDDAFRVLEVVGATEGAQEETAARTVAAAQGNEAAATGAGESAAKVTATSEEMAATRQEVAAVSTAKATTQPAAESVERSASAVPAEQAGNSEARQADKGRPAEQEEFALPEARTENAGSKAAPSAQAAKPVVMQEGAEQKNPGDSGETAGGNAQGNDSMQQFPTVSGMGAGETADASPTQHPLQAKSPLHQSILSQVRDGVATRDPKGNGEMTIRLKPDQLGELKIQVRMEENRLTIEVRADSGMVKDLLMSNIDSLKEALSGKNFTMEGFDVSTGGGSFSTLAEQKGSTRQHTASRLGRGGGYLQGGETAIRYLTEETSSLLDVRF